MEKLYKAIKILLCSLSVLALLAIIAPIFICDSFIINGSSMEPTMSQGERVWVNKLLMGARIYKKIDFSSPILESFRMPGIREIKCGDIAVFNNPYGRNREKIEFRINYVYVKRCLGCPGDTVGISNSMYYNTRIDGPFGVSDSQLTLRQTPDSLIPDYAFAAYPYSYDFNWTIKELGPVIVPATGMTINLDKANTQLYSHVIEYETGNRPVWTDNGCLLNGNVSDIYTFCENYCYFVIFIYDYIYVNVCI